MVSGGLTDATQWAGKRCGYGGGGRRRIQYSADKKDKDQIAGGAAWTSQRSTGARRVVRVSIQAGSLGAARTPTPDRGQ
jgi:hypothetical protein